MVNSKFLLMDPSVWEIFRKQEVLVWGSVDGDQRGPWQSHGTRLRSHYHTCPGSCSDGHLLGFERSQGYFRKVKQHKGPFMGFYTETNPVSHSQVVRSVYNPLFCLHLITVILFVCVLLIHLEASILCVTVHHDLLQAILFLLAVASCMEKCCKDCLLASAP